MLKNIAKIFTGTLFSRIFGFLREIIVASYFGCGYIADAFTLALTFPNLFRQILGEDMVERAFMPPFKSMYDKGNIDKSWKYVSVIFNWFFFSLLGATVILYILTPLFFSLKDIPLIKEFAFNNSNFDYDLTLKLILILLPFMLFIGLAAFLGSMLNFFEKNWIFSFAPASLSVGVIIGIVFLEPLLGGYSIAIGYVLGALLQFLIQIPFIFQKKFKTETKLKYHLILKSESLNFDIVKRESKIITLNALFNKTTEVFGRFYAATIITGGTSSLFYAQRLYQLPFAIISLSIARGINPILNTLKNNSDQEVFNSKFVMGLNLYYMVFFPIITFLLISSQELVYITFFRGSFDSNSLNLTTSAFNMYALGLIPMSIVAYYSRILSLFNKNKYALNVSIVSAIANIGFAVLLVNFTSLKHDAIALASSISFGVNMILLGKYLKKELGDFVVREKSILITNFLMTIILVAITSIVFKYKMIYSDTILQALISMSIKLAISLSIFFTFFLSYKKTRLLIFSILKR